MNYTLFLLIAAGILSLLATLIVLAACYVARATEDQRRALHRRQERKHALAKWLVVQGGVK